ncbi:MAG: hypothetical protein IT178_18355 [Acidobacteria bacterium]|nr:hypothetical protein [Acidobacteriota bacterium]
MRAHRSLVLVAIAVLLTSVTTAAAMHYSSAAERMQRSVPLRNSDARSATAADVGLESAGVAQPNPVAPQVLSGPDVGFRIEGVDPRTGNPTGIWVVRVNGEWVEAMSKPVLRRGE